MKLRKLARQLAAAAVAGAMTLSLCLPALAGSWNISNGQGIFEEVYSIQVTGTASGRRVQKSGKPSAPGAGDEIGIVQNEDAAEETVLSGSGSPRVYLDGRNAPVSVTLDGLNVERTGGSAASTPAIDVAGDVDMTLTDKNSAKGTNYGVWTGDNPGVSANLTIGGTGELEVSARRAIDLGGGSFTLNSGKVTAAGADRGISANQKVTVNGGSLTASGQNAIYSSGDILVNDGSVDATFKDQNESLTGTPAAIFSGNGDFRIGGGTVNIHNAKTGSYPALEAQNVNISGGKVSVEGSGTLRGVYGLTIGGSADVTADKLFSSGDVTISGGTVNAGEGGITSTQKDVVISGGTVNAGTGTIASQTGSLLISGGEVTAPYLFADQIKISGGKVNAFNLGARQLPLVVLSGNAQLTIDIQIDNSADLSKFADLSGLTTEGFLRYKAPDDPDTDENGYVTIYGTLEPSADTDTGSASSPADNVGGALATAIIGSAAVWGGYEVATRVILHKMLPEGAAIPKTQAELALLLWNTAGQPEPVNTPAVADGNDTTAKAAQWCAEQGYLSGTFKPEKHVAKYNVIRAWAKAFPQAA